MEKRKRQTEKNSAAMYYKLLRHSYNVTAQFPTRYNSDLTLSPQFSRAASRIREKIDIRECAESAGAFRVNAKRRGFQRYLRLNLTYLSWFDLSRRPSPKTEWHAPIDIRYKGHAFVHRNMNTRLPDRRQNRHKSTWRTWCEETFIPARARKLSTFTTTTRESDRSRWENCYRVRAGLTRSHSSAILRVDASLQTAHAISVIFLSTRTVFRDSSWNRSKDLFLKELSSHREIFLQG